MAENTNLWKSKYIPGQNWVQCDICSFKRRASETRYNSDGLLVCADTCWEPEHPQLRLKAVKEKIRADKIRPENDGPTITEDTRVTADDL